MKRFFLAAACTFALCACNQNSDTIKIGYVGPLTGDAASYGVDTLNAVTIHVDEINAAGGINGKKIELIAEDGRCNGADSASAAQKLVNVDKVVAILGGQCSSETLAIAPITEAAKVILFSPISSAPKVSEAGDYVFRDYPSDAFKGKVITKLLAEKKFTKIAMITENTDFCQGIRGSVTQTLAVGSALAFDEVVDAGTKDFRTLLTRLKDMKVDALIVNGQSDAVNGELAKQARELGITAPFYGTDTADSATLATLAGKAVDGMIFINTSSKLGDTGTGSFASKFRSKFGEPKSNMSYATLAYDGIGVISEAITKVGTDGTAIRDYFYNLEAYTGAAGSFHFDEKGDVVGIGYAVKTFESGAIVELKQVAAE